MRKDNPGNFLNTCPRNAAILIGGLLVLALSSGCYKNTVVDGIEVWSDGHDEQSTRVVNLAAFETECPKEQLDVTLLETLPGSYKFPTQYGVSGCGYRMRYVHANGQWILNSASRDGEMTVPNSAE